MMDFNIFNAAIKVAAFWASFIPLLYTLSQSHFKRLQHISFLILCITTTGQALFGTGREFFSVFLNPSTGNLALYIFEAFFAFFHVAFQTAFSFYVVVASGFLSKSNKNLITLFWVPCMILEVLFFTNPLNHFFYQFQWDATLSRFIFVPGFGYHALWLMGGLYAAVAVFVFIKNLSGVQGRKIIAFVVMSFVMLLAIAVENININFQVQILIESFTTIFALIWIEADGSLIHSGTGLYNRVAFLDDNKVAMGAKQKYKIYAITLLNHDFIRRAYSEEIRTRLCDIAAKELTKLAKYTTPYYLGNGKYAFFYFDKDDFKERAFIDELKRTLDHDYEPLPGILIQTSWQVAIAKVPEDLNELTGLDDLFEGFPNGHGVVIKKGDDVSFIRRRNDVLGTFERGLKNNNFEVYFQPIYDVNQDKISSAEALLRLSDPLLGRVSPSEFIPIAEASGAIKALGEFVFKETIRFYKEENLLEKGLETISINVSVKQLQREDLATFFITTIKEYGVDPSNVSIEITESEDAGRSSFFTDQLNLLRHAGFKLSLDDYGTGYSNLHRIITTDFTSVKMDSSLLKNALDEKGKKLLMHSIKSMLSYDYKVIQEGVETKEQLEEVIKYGASYLQGYYFAEPMPEKQFIKYLSSFKGIKPKEEI